MTAPPSIDALLPCPFCGGSAKFSQIEMQVMCRTRGCTGQSWMFDTLGEAVAAWNRRATLAPAAPVDGMERGFDAAIRAVRAWSAGVYSAQAKKWLHAVAAERIRARSL